jgi:hypothetical protein
VPTPGDIALLVVLLACVPLAWRATAPGAAPGTFRVRAADGVERVLDAGRDAAIVLDGPLGPTRLRVQDGAAWIEASPCRNQLCRRMGRLAGSGGVLACLPNRVIVSPGAPGAGVDAITR